MSHQYFNGDFAIGEAQKCRQMLLEQTGSKSTWCIVTKKGFWPASYFFPGDEDLVREKLNHGHEVLLVFAVGPRHVLAGGDYQAMDPDSAPKLLRRHARIAMKERRLGYRRLSRIPT
ncbi:MAG TPA: hypothetical protein VFT88_13115 [Acidobacteriaceae bacterium]|jgi:hypothetical protein|nr:hypothetical protein [Acidobacteriaceae bacterium]